MSDSKSSLIVWSCRLVVRAAVAVSLVLMLSACDGPSMAETDQFEAAEVHYRAGDYERALDGYQDFLQHYPQSPLADVAEQRIRTINREVSSMLGRSDMPRPVYQKTGRVGTTANGESVETTQAEAGTEADEAE